MNKPAALVWLLLAALTGCRPNDPVAETPSVALGSAFRVAVNDSVRLVSAGAAPLTFAFVHMQDGRCPNDPRCTLKPGNTRVEFELRAQNEKVRQFLCLGDCQDWYPALPAAQAQRAQDSATVTLAGRAYRVVLQRADTLWFRPNPARATFLVRQP